MNKYLISLESADQPEPANTELRQKTLMAKSCDLLSVKVGGRYTIPRTFGIYRVWLLIDGHLRHFYYFGNYPIRQYDLARKFGEANLVALFEDWSDARELTYLLNGNRRTLSGKRSLASSSRAHGPRRGKLRAN